MPTYYLDAIKQVRLGEVGVSPGFRIPPPDVVPGAQRIVQDPGEAVLTREISEAVLHEISILSRPAVAGSTVELRKEEFDDGKSSSISKWDKFLYLL